MQNSSLWILWILSLKALYSVLDHQRKAGKILLTYPAVKRCLLSLLFLIWILTSIHALYNSLTKLSFSLLIMSGVFLLFISQTLSSLALVFALHHYKPTPLYVMDEIDAALGTFINFVAKLFCCNCWLCNTLNYVLYGLADFKNVSIVGHYVKDRTKDVQFIIIR